MLVLPLTADSVLSRFFLTIPCASKWSTMMGTARPAGSVTSLAPRGAQEHVLPDIRYLDLAQPVTFQDRKSTCGQENAGHLR